MNNPYGKSVTIVGSDNDLIDIIYLGVTYNTSSPARSGDKDNATDREAFLGAIGLVGCCVEIFDDPKSIVIKTDKISFDNVLYNGSQALVYGNNAPVYVGSNCGAGGCCAMFSNISYRGETFDCNIDECAIGGKLLVTKLDFMNTDTASDFVAKVQGHGGYTSYTKKLTRYIDINFAIYGKHCDERLTILKKVNELFQVEWNPSCNNLGFYDFSFTDCNGEKWIMKAKVVDTPQYIDVNGCCIVEFKVRLLVGDNSGKVDTCMYSDTIYSCEGQNTIMGMDFDGGDLYDGDTLPRPFRYQHGCEVNYTGVSQAKVECEIEVIDSFPTNGYIMVRTLNSMSASTTLFLNNINPAIGDIIVIKDNKVTHNGVDISNSIVDGFAQFPYLINTPIQAPFTTGNNMLVVDSGDEHYRLKVTRKWRNYFC